MRMPEIQNELRAIARNLAKEHPEVAERLLVLVAEMYRRRPVRRAPRQRTLTRAEYTPLVIAYALAHPEATYMEIGHHFGINTGRVSEVLADFRK